MHHSRQMSVRVPTSPHKASGIFDITGQRGEKKEIVGAVLSKVDGDVIDQPSLWGSACIKINLAKLVKYSSAIKVLFWQTTRPTIRILKKAVKSKPSVYSTDLVVVGIVFAVKMTIGTTHRASPLQENTNRKQLFGPPKILTWYRKSQLRVRLR